MTLAACPRCDAADAESLLGTLAPPFVPEWAGAPDRPLEVFRCEACGCMRLVQVSP